MTNRQTSKLSMAKTVQLIITTFTSILSSVAFIKAITDLQNTVANIDGYAQAQSKQITGTATDKAQAEEAAIAAAIAIIGPARSYALANNNNTLYETLDYTESGLKRTRDAALINTLTLIRDTIQPLLNNLADYDVLPAHINALTTAIAAYQPLVAAPRAAISVKVAASNALVAEFETLDKVLTRFDGLVDAKKTTNANFYNAYYTARAIVDTGGGSGGEDVKPSAA
ncbi:MAG: hypothetical protein QM541_15340 [Flavobacterium sp.]|nr:hypothetical protein [Flavobacterium sp.]